LIELRGRLFGTALDCLARCPRCEADLEVNLDVADLLVADPPLPAGPLQFESRGHHLQIRPPTSADLDAVLEVPDRDAARSELLSRCVVRAEMRGEEVPPGALPEAVRSAVSVALERADPQADVKIGLSCPECGAAWEAPFDPAAFLWAEVGAWAERTLREVHALASAYGWAEADILSIPPSRRRRYLEMLPA